MERPFRTVKEAHETLYHFHQPETEEEANTWLHHYLITYNNQPHRREAHSRFEDWLKHAPADGIQEMCVWDRFCTFAREAESRKVGIDARIAVEGTVYEVDPVLAGETVILWWGLFDSALYVEFDAERFGPYVPVEGAIPLHRYRAFRKNRRDEQYTQVEALAKVIQLPRTVLSGEADVQPADGYENRPIVSKPFVPEETNRFPSVVMAKLAIAKEIGMALAQLPQEDKTFIDEVVNHTLECESVLAQMREYFRKKQAYPPLRPIL